MTPREGESRPWLVAVSAGNLAVKFALEVAAVAAFAYWGFTVGSGVLSVALGLAAPVLAIVSWGRFAAPMAQRRLPLRHRAPFELGVFTLAALAMLTGSTAVAIAFACVVVVNAVLLTVLDQWTA